MKRLIDILADDTDFFVEHVQITAIVFDNTNDVTIWATTFMDEELHFFHLGLEFQSLDLLLRMAGDRAGELQEEVADALANVTEWPCLLEYTTEDDPPVLLPGVALKLSCTYSVEEDEEEDDPTPQNVFYLESVFLRIEP
ncbi:hypothetical protein LJY25_03995 [Hymenobacter sp. BT175]|uniref:hypothetical protein n=1 Tax=Hymenobacter translucens TaxID=2886507 RepID=UPI001D0EBB75|nr:hypothetical protein [Hymenobacter translucens]MCC2545594.1 hypothetical protein [Hymenobacter translucens]